MLAPTTLLARQHFRVFAERFADLPIRVEQLSRFVPAKTQKQVKADLGEGKVDEWVAGASANGEMFRAADHIPFPETRSYVERVLDARGRYRRTYPRELGL